MKAVFIFLFSVLFFSCTEKKTTPKQTELIKEKTVYEPGKIYNQNTYCVYLPISYDSTKAFPLIYFFDPQGKGNFPVEKYKVIADSLGIILVGSNATKNGMDWNTANVAANQIFADTKEKFRIDNTKIFTCGFSGGGRIAGNLALQNSNIAGVISCSAGLPVQISQIRKNLIFAGIAGKEDMNLTEVYDAGEALKNSEIKHLIKYFNGPHEWPPIETMQEAIQFCLAPTPSKTENTIDKKIIDKEKKEKQFYSEAFLKNDFNWWKMEFQNIQQKIEKNRGEEKYMHIRLKNFLSLAAYSYSNSALNKRNIPEADKFLNVYKLVDPANAEHAYLRAKYFMILNNHAEAETALKEAADLDFSDSERIQSEQLFITLQNSEGYKKIIGQ